MDPDRISTFLEDKDNSGILYWKVQVGQRGVIGSVAGYLHIVKGEKRWKIRIGGRTYLRSILVFAIHNNRWPSESLVLDHIDKNTINDCINNLREVTQAINMETRVYKFGHAHAAEYKS